MTQAHIQAAVLDDQAVGTVNEGPVVVIADDADIRHLVGVAVQRAGAHIGASVGGRRRLRSWSWSRMCGASSSISDAPDRHPARLISV